jgi:hypothetical protein
MSHQHDREFFRLQYPPPAAPKFVMDGMAHRIVDIGEGGFRYAAEDGAPAAGPTVKGVIEFEDQDPLEVEGSVVRTQAGEVDSPVRGHPRATAGAPALSVSRLTLT